MRLVEGLQIAGAILGSMASLFTVIEKRLVLGLALVVLAHTLLS